MKNLFQLFNFQTVLYVTIFMADGGEPAAAVEVEPRVMIEHFAHGNCAVDVIERDTVLFGRMAVAALVTGDAVDACTDELLDAAIKLTVEDWLYQMDEPSALPPHQNPLNGLGLWMDDNE